ncbi:MAG: NAD-dependent epimerase/dehydratase family protein, partial [Cyanothece sp. SIO2G6]|nr:NAD-dependent epimerase/dehydratase family protein [Cyanothece sp. SIO2G6]
MATAHFQGMAIAITGASGALGQALTHELAQQGATIIVNRSKNTRDGGIHHVRNSRSL